MKSEVGVNHQNEVIEVPRLRFTPFNKPWNKFKLKDVATFINGRAYKQNELLDSGKYRVLRVGNFFTNTSWYFSDLELDDKYYAEEGDLLYTWSASFGPHIWHGEKLIYHYHIWKIELSNRFDKLFATYLLDYDKEKILSDKNGSTMVHITKKGMEEKEVKLPSFSEQTKIGSFFKNLDDTISLHQQELDALKKTKQGFLQKMFPKGENIIPELRFSEFNDPWFITELSDIVSEISTGKSKHVKSDSKGNYKILGSTGVIGYGDSYEYEGDFLLTARVGANAGQLYKYSGKVKITDNTVFIKGDNLTFIHPLLEFFDLKKLSFGSGQPLIKTSELKKLKLRVPLLSEQVKIGKFFRQLDEVIELKEQELEFLIQTKKGFLQKMFV